VFVGTGEFEKLTFRLVIMLLTLLSRFRNSSLFRTAFPFPPNENGNIRCVNSGDKMGVMVSQSKLLSAEMKTWALSSCSRLIAVILGESQLV
jgi:hypothetical protein